MNEEQMTDEEEQMMDALSDGVIQVTCPLCGAEIDAEPDAKDIWCPLCDKLVTPRDSLVVRGLI